MAKSASQLQREIDTYLRTDGGRHARKASNGRLVILDDDGQTVTAATDADLHEYGNTGKVRGRNDYEIGVQFVDDNENDVAISVTRAEVKRFYL